MLHKVSRVSRNLIDAAATAVHEIDVVVTAMVLHQMSFDVSELASADATTAVLRPGNGYASALIVQ